MKKLVLTTLPLLALSAAALAPKHADACGGTFCDSGPQTMPVDQTGENILFNIGPDTVEAHIQIQYDPNSGASQFAWVIPVTAVPDFEVGSQLFFDAVLAGSVPSYGNQVTSDFCGDDDGGFGDEAGGTAASDGGDGDPNNEGGDPEIVLQKTVGAFEIAVLDGGTVDGVMQWLADNGYQQDPAAEPILAEYLADDFLFVAMKLANEAGVDEIHPIVIRYSGTEPCVPIRLTRIAAQEDMDIRAFFLGQARTVPINYRHVLINPLKLDWFNFAANYKEVITLAVDAQQADGNAFVTEYAGPSNVIQPTYYSDLWDAAPIAALATSPVGIYEVLQQQGLMFCDPEWDTKCSFNNPMLEPILSQYVPVPAGVEAVDFYADLAAYEAQIDLTAWDAAAFAASFDERVVKPALNAFNLVQDNPYLTRMYTTISPTEMNEDPMFRENANLSDVANIQLSTQTSHCDGSTTVTLPDGRSVFFPAGADLVWPDFGDEMPWEEDVDQANMADDAPLVNLVDNTDQINELLDAYNAQKGDADGDGLPDEVDVAGCDCSIDERNAAGGIAFGFMTLGIFGLIRRRR
jgi:hypothetical protein